MRAILILGAVALFAVSCSGGSSTSVDEDALIADQTTTTVEIDPLPNQSSSTTSTTEAEVPATLAESTTTTEPLGPVAPLTGLPVEDEITRPALLVKIDNHRNARPQWGINAADIVYEEVVEADITRLAALFHSIDASPVGPVRSARTSDFDLLTDKNTPLFANSGGNPTVLSLLRNVDAINVNVNALPELYYRERSKSAPHNLLTSTADLFSARGDDGGLPPAIFEYRSEGEALSESAVPTTGIDIDYGQHEISYDWDASLGGWARTQNGSQHTDADGVLVAPPNVVVQVISYGRSPADPVSPEAITVGEGDAFVLVDGHIIEARWSRPTRTDVTTLTTLDGEPIKLDPGRTWVALPRAGQATTRQ
ncbi:MAG: DUF3048 domain-containing protein [Actinomycetia bacterium]|nr:DUF3048 domain-containing protein [Actinomycetes bacterium]MCP4958204.1 DUF3048 domain-containing protein [Actinomycetes bacterium]